MNDDDLIEVTPEMIETGLYELHSHSFGEDMREVIRSVYVSMAWEARQQHLEATKKSMELMEQKNAADWDNWAKGLK